MRHLDFLTMPKRRAESGQSIVLIAIVFVIVLGFAGLAIDGGGLLLLRRDSQNAADAAAVAAAYAGCVNGDFLAVGQQTARDNGFADEQSNAVVRVQDVTHRYDPDRGGQRLYVEVTITATKPGYLIGILYPDDLSVTSRSVASCQRGFNPAAYNAALFALGTDCPAGRGDLHLSGANQTIYGDVIAYGDIVSAGSADRVFDGDVIAGQQNGVDPALVRGDHRANVPVESIGIAPPGYFDRDDYLLHQHGEAAIMAQAAGDYFYNTVPNPLRGLIIWDRAEALHITNNHFAAPTTIITTADLHLVNVTGDWLPYVDNLAIFSTAQSDGCNTSGGVQISGSRSQFRGIVYAPDAHVQFAAADQNAGAIIARSIAVSGANSVFRYDPLLFPAGDSTIQIDE